MNYHPITIEDKTYYPCTVKSLTRDHDAIYATLKTTELEGGGITEILGVFVPSRLYNWIKKSFLESLLLYVNISEKNNEIDAVFPRPEPIRNAADDKRARAIFAE